MLRFFLGITLAQVATALVIWLYPGGTTLDTLLPLIFSILLLSTVISLWFSTIAKQLSDKRVATLKQRFASEKEKLNINAERAKNKLVKKTQKEIELQARRAKSTANVKIGTALAVAAGFGLVMMFTQFVTLGLLTLTTAGGAVGGYLARARRQDALEGPEYKLIEAAEVEITDAEILPSSDVDETQAQLTVDDDTSTGEESNSIDKPQA